MNITELLKELDTTLRESGWLDKATEYMQQHPEHFHACTHLPGFISSVRLDVSFQPDTLSDLRAMKPCVFIQAGSLFNLIYERDTFKDGHVWCQTRNEDGLVAEVRYEAGRDTGTQQS